MDSALFIRSVIFFVGHTLLLSSSHTNHSTHEFQQEMCSFSNPELVKQRTSSVYQ